MSSTSTLQPVQDLALVTGVRIDCPCGRYSRTVALDDDLLMMQFKLRGHMRTCVVMAAVSIALQPPT